MKRTDLACEIASDNQHFEGIELKEYNIGSVGVSHIIISKDGEKSTGRPKGTYITLHCRRRDRYDEVRAVAQVLSGMVPDGDILTAGFGNCDITPDSLGTRTVRRIAATAHLAAHNDFAALGMRKVYAVEAGVTGRTGIESTDSIELAVRHVKPQAVIVIDSLACAEADRLCSTIQITDTGITPGSGVGNDRKGVNKSALKVPVIAIGVPTVIDLDTISPERTEKFMVTPRDIDGVITHYAEVLAEALNSVLNPTLTADELEQLIV